MFFTDWFAPVKFFGKFLNMNTMKACKVSS